MKVRHALSWNWLSPAIAVETMSGALALYRADLLWDEAENYLRDAMVKSLAANNVDLGARDAQGRTAADIAKGAASSSGRSVSQPHPETEALLRQLMANKTPPTASTQPQ